MRPQKLDIDKRKSQSSISKIRDGDDERMDDEADRAMDDDPVVDNGLTNDLVETPSNIKLEIESSLPKHLTFNRNNDEPKSNYQRHMSDDEDSEDNRPPRTKELKLEKIKFSDHNSDTKMAEERDDSSEAASVQRATTLNPTTLASNFLLVDA